MNKKVLPQIRRIDKELIKRIVLFLIILVFGNIVISLIFEQEFLKLVYPEITSFLKGIFNILILIYIFRIHQRKNWDIINPKPFRLKLLLLFIPLILVIKFGGGIVSLLFFGEQGLTSSNEEQWKYLAQSDPQTWTQYFILFIKIVILTPIFEELFVRGVLYNSFKLKYGIFIGIFLSSFFFGLIHVLPFLIVATFILGVGFSIIYEKTKNIFYNILLHSLINSLPFVISLAMYDWSFVLK